MICGCLLAHIFRWLSSSVTTVWEQNSRPSQGLKQQRKRTVHASLATASSSSSLTRTRIVTAGASDLGDLPQIKGDRRGQEVPECIGPFTAWKKLLNQQTQLSQCMLGVGGYSWGSWRVDSIKAVNGQIAIGWREKDQQGRRVLIGWLRLGFKESMDKIQFGLN